MKISLDNIDVFVFDFDGVLTNNLVQIDENGKESVSCSRADGLAFDVLRKLNKSVYILSTEKNPVVLARAKKLKVKVFKELKIRLTHFQFYQKVRNMILVGFCM